MKRRIIDARICQGQTNGTFAQTRANKLPFFLVKTIGPLFAQSPREEDALLYLNFTHLDASKLILNLVSSEMLGQRLAMKQREPMYDSREE